ncbi:hypothetical protein VKT23_010589 [Stygiomarasmius scandens]|uniref:DUF6535 domain-containing protein n=1 Tax=Marasmiellus scandens TaxID=2682957 RepID=A0ABR1JAN2_9AGAR
MSTDNIPLLPLYNNANSQETTRDTSSEGQAEPAQNIRQHTRQQTTATPEERKKEDPERLFSIPKYQPTYTGGRSYNYEEKYAPDPSGERLSDNARVWKVYLDEAESYDEDMLKGFRDTIDSLLVFAALFSAVVTTFVIKTIEALEPDFGQATVILMMEQNQLLRAAGNATAINNVQPSPAGLATASPSQSDLWINGFFFASLSLSLATALISVLVKQWLQAYASMSSGNAKERAMIRQFRFSGFEKWGMQGIIGGLPLILHASLGLFLVGLALEKYSYRENYVQAQILDWLFSLESNKSIQRITAQALTDAFQQHDFSSWPEPSILTIFMKGVNLPLVAQTAWNGLKEMKDDENNSFHTWSSLITLWNQRIKDMPDDFDSSAKTKLQSIQREPSIDDAAYSGHLGVVKYLVENGADINAVGEKYGTALQAAAYGGYLDVVKFLTKKGADVNAVGGRSALQAAALRGHLDVVKFLIEKGADVSAVRRGYETALQAAATEGHLVVVKFLLAQGTDINVVGGFYGTALQAAVSRGHLDVVKFLVGKGADLNAVGGRYGTALKAAQAVSEHHIAEFLQSKGARG